ncbi:MAG: urease accessory protein UreD [Rubrivivax sp.]|nr:urease accessory protein UreD [Rubrivivax sp.]
MAWHGKLNLSYRVDHGGAAPRCLVADLHDGPLRVLAALRPEGPSVCHSVIVHPPGGIAGGDHLDLDLTLGEGSHALLTTPGATRFYRSAGEPASQSVRARLAEGARLEWLPLETLVYSGALAESRSTFELAPGAEMIGREIVALGLPAASLGFERGCYTQHLELPGVWLERGRIDAQDLVLLDSPLGMARRRVLATLWFSAGSPIAQDRREALLAAARGEAPQAAAGAAGAAADAQGDAAPTTHGSTSPHDRLVVLRVLAWRVEPAVNLLNRIWAQWRQIAWALPACAPRVWQT